MLRPILLAAASLVFPVAGRAEVSAEPCAAFDARGAMREVLVTGEKRPDDVPVYDVRLRFPIADTARYGSPPSAKVLDAALLTLVYPGVERGQLDVMLHDRKAINEIVPIHVQFRTKTPLEDVPAFIASHSVPAPDGLIEITGAQGPWKDYRLYATGRMNAWENVLVCKRPGTVPFPSCTLDFDYRHIDVEVSFRAVDLPKWQEIRAYVERYTACSYQGENQIL